MQYPPCASLVLRVTGLEVNRKIGPLTKRLPFTQGNNWETWKQKKVGVKERAWERQTWTAWTGGLPRSSDGIQWPFSICWGRQNSLTTRTAYTTELTCLPVLCCVALSRSVVSGSLWPLEPARLLCPWDAPGKNTGVGCRALLQGSFPNQGLNPGIPHWGRFLTIWAARETQQFQSPLFCLSPHCWSLVWLGLSSGIPFLENSMRHLVVGLHFLARWIKKSFTKGRSSGRNMAINSALELGRLGLE